MNKSLRLALVFFVGAALAAPAFGASSAAQAENVAKSFLKMEKSLKRGQAQIRSVLSALNALTTESGGDLTKKYTAFAKETKNMKSEYRSAKRRSLESKKLREEYLAAWESDQKQIQNVDLQKASESRRLELQPTIDLLRGSLEGADATMQPFLQDLTDLSLYLGNNLTFAGIAGAGVLAQKCAAGGAQVNADVDTALGALKTLRNQIAPGVRKK